MNEVLSAAEFGHGDAGLGDHRGVGYERSFTSFLLAMSPEALKAKNADLRKMRIHRRTNLSLDDLARWLNPIVAGWMNYYGRYYRTVMDPLLRRLDHLNAVKNSTAGGLAGRGSSGGS
jgi:hypothetical protein